MAAPLRLELRDASSSYSFDVDGEPRRAWSFEHKETSHPRAIKRVIDTWTVDRAVMALGSAATGDPEDDAVALLGKITTFANFVRDRTTSPVLSARLVRTDTSASVETLGVAPQQAFKVLDAQITEYVGPDGLDVGSWRIVLAVSLAMSAEIVFADTDTVLDFRQRLTYNYSRGLVTVSLITEAETAEGTDVETILRTFGKLDITDYGANYHWVTNGDDGVDVDLEDCDERAATLGGTVLATASAVAGLTRRTPTRGTATSTIKSVGVTLGTLVAGNGLEDPFYEVTTETTRLERITTTRASATGPGALGFVMARQPARWTRRVITNETAQRSASGLWEFREHLLVQSRISAVISGGGRRQRIELGSNGRAPKWRPGPHLPWTLEVEVDSELRAATATRDSMPMPADPGAPWELDREASREDAFPRKIEVAVDATQQLWGRQARLVYRAVEKPDPDRLRTALIDGDPRPTALDW